MKLYYNFSEFFKGSRAVVIGTSFASLTRNKHIFEKINIELIYT